MRLLRDGGPLLRVGHRGAAALAPENTLAGFDRARDVGVDAIEFDVLALPDGRLVLGHEPAQLRLRRPTPLDDALAWFAAHPHVALHVDLKLRRGEAEVARAIAAAGLADRAVVSTPHVHGLVDVARAVPGLAIGLTYPDDRRGLARRRALVPVLLGAVVGMRTLLPRRLEGFVRRAGATALMLHHLLVSRPAVARAHELGVAIVAWTVDDPRTLRRLDALGVDAVVTNDPRIFGRPPLH